MNNPILNIGLVFGVYQAVNYFKLASVENTLFIRVFYFASLALQLSVMAYIRSLILKVNDTTALVYLEPKKPFDDTPQTTTETTVAEYDISQTNAQFTQMASSAAIIGFLHFYWGYLPPLIMQGLMGVKNLWAVPVFRIWILNEEPLGELSRPFKVKNMFEGLAEPVGPKEAKKLEKKAEKKKAIGKVE